MDEKTVPSYLYRSNHVQAQELPLAFLSDKAELKTVVSDLCKKLHHPVALIDYNVLMEIEDAEKLESMVEMYPMRRSCSIFRKCAGETYCSQCDRFHARCMDVDKASIENHLQSRLEQVPSFFYPEYRDNQPIVKEGFDRPVIEYHCPMLGYRELLFPLLYEKRIFGVFFAGQIMVYDADDVALNKTISESFFRKQHPDELFGRFVELFNAQVGENEKLDCGLIKELIITSDSKAQEYDDILGFKNSEKKEQEYFSKSFRTQEEYHTFIGSVCEEITEIEKNLTKTYEERRKRIISETLGQIADSFFERYKLVHNRTFKNKHEQRTEELKSSWEALKAFASDILHQFKLEKIILFGDEQGIRIETTSKKEIAFVTPHDKGLKGSFDFSCYSINGISDSADSLTKPTILSGISQELPRENSILIQCHDIAMLMLVRDLDGHRKLYLSLTVAIKKELERINSVIALCFANLTKEKYLLTLRMYRHENAHISTRLMGNIDRYFENGGQRFLSADEEKRVLVCNDLKNTVQLISNIADNISFVTGTGIAAKDSEREAIQFDVVDMLHKWQIMFRDELEIRNLDIIVFRGGSDSSKVGYQSIGFQLEKYMFKRVGEITRQRGKYAAAPREILINARLFELLVYNIVDNAVKYAYRGTSIYLIWGRVENDYELSVTSYGPRMPNGEAMYGLYIRGNDARLLQGDGLGLYVVAKIAEKLGLSVSHESDRISLYNVPLIPWYGRTDFSGVKNYSRIDEHTLTQKNDEAQVDLAINRNSFTEIREEDLTPMYLSERIAMETWRTTFYVWIPISNK